MIGSSYDWKGGFRGSLNGRSYSQRTTSARHHGRREQQRPDLWDHAGLKNRCVCSIFSPLTVTSTPLFAYRAEEIQTHALSTSPTHHRFTNKQHAVRWHAGMLVSPCHHTIELKKADVMARVGAHVMVTTPSPTHTHATQPPSKLAKAKHL